MNKIFVTAIVLFFVIIVSSIIYGVSYYTSYPAFDNPQWTECNIEDFSLSKQGLKEQCEKQHNSTVSKT